MSDQRISVGELSDLLARAWERIVSKDGACKIANAIVRTALQKDNRVNPVEDSVEDLQKAVRIQTKCIEVANWGAVRSYDLCGMPGITFMPELVEKTVSLAKEYGVGLVSLKNSGGVDTLSTWLLDIPNHDCIGMFVWNGGAYTTVPFGSTEPFFGTNPIAYALPTSEEPVLLDMSTSEIPFMNLMRAIHDRVPLPDRAGLDELGRPTTDPQQVYDVAADSDVKLLPMGGGHKGSAIMLLIEVLTGALIDSKMAREANSATQREEEFGGLLAAIDIGAFTSPALFRGRMTKMLRQIRSSRPALGSNSVRVPGDGSYERERERLHSGTICLDQPLLEELRRLAG